MYLTDSHTLIFFFLGDLNKKVCKIFENRNNIYIPTIVLAEMSWILKRRSLGLGFDVVLKEIKKNSQFSIVDFNYNVFEEFLKIKGLEMHDQIIVATAKHLRLPLITKDKEIRESELVETIW